MIYTIAETRNPQTGDYVAIIIDGNEYYLEFGHDGKYVISRHGGREMFDLFYKIGRYVTESLYSYEYKADMIVNA